MSSSEVLGGAQTRKRRREQSESVADENWIREENTSLAPTAICPAEQAAAVAELVGAIKDPQPLPPFKGMVRWFTRVSSSLTRRPAFSVYDLCLLTLIFRSAEEQAKCETIRSRSQSEPYLRQWTRPEYLLVRRRVA
jgi:hypothetical protein